MSNDRKRKPTSPLAKFLFNAKKHQGDDEAGTISGEQMELLQSLLEGQKAIQEDFQEFRKDLKSNTSRIDTVEDKYGQLETNVSALDTGCKDLISEFQDLKTKYEADHQLIKDLKRQLDYAKSKINSLETRLSSLSLEIRDRSLVINGIPEDESTPLISQVHDLLGKLFLNLHRSDIDLVYRTGGRFGNAPRPVHVSFLRACDKREIFDRRDILREEECTKWIYVNEDIPPELRGPRADMRALARYATEIGYTAKAVGDKLIIENRVYRANELHLLPPELSLEKVKIRAVPNGLAFQGEAAYLSNLYPAEFVMRGIRFNSAEQAYQFYRAACVNNLEASQSILKSDDTKDIQSAGNPILPNPKWDQQKDDKMMMIVLNKFTQNKELALKLIATGNTRLIEATKCPYWGAGLTLNARDWNKGYFPGQNRLREIIMKVRDELRPLFQPAIIPHPDNLSAAESLALATSDRANQIPVPSPTVVKQMIQQPPPPPPLALSNRFAPLQDGSVIPAKDDQDLKAMAAAILPTAVPPLPPGRVETPQQPSDIAVQPMITQELLSKSPAKGNSEAVSPPRSTNIMDTTASPNENQIMD